MQIQKARIRLLRMNIKMRHIKVYDISLLFVLFSFLSPQIIDYTIPYSREIIYLFRIASIVLFCVSTKTKKPDIKQIDTFWFVIFVIAFGALETLVAIVKEVNFLTFRYLLFHMSFVLIMYTTVIKKPDLLVKETFWLFGIYNFAQLLTVIVFFPKGIISSADYLNGGATYFLGGKNQAFISMFIFLASFAIKDLLDYGTINKWIYIVISAFIFESILIDSMASLACLILFGLGCFVVTTKANKYIYHTLNPYLIFVIASILFIVFCVANTLSSFSETGLMAELFHKYGRNMSFTGRTSIWIQSINMFIENPLMGGSGEYELLGTTLNQAHNAFFDVLGKYGLMGFVPYILIVISITRILRKMKKAKVIYSLCNVSFFILMVHCMIEFMDFYSLLTIFFLFIAAREIVITDNVNNKYIIIQQIKYRRVNYER